ncbi:tRNA (adenosine(37)-N6)-threonylcarbamoyltransferase complex dimerization subunit type 1 TsaB [Aquicoccus sp. G2-2]|uniref:tRNA (adenosine(37)-N6)-threonylcarbamoyltransferase complex dimerization subunit type 1 TsaB n=1 Tax=Aquicoccus sp. G2-2 TaxID=3092120 RepID=UPI002ADF319B|nr:tRNA (adenosine(37)-N6)-threonylcarbamoyltransferase complex dimerization subunit type 1 TsaB [Aquicoccus sp. G2-2]MEA1112408.1 tRNA (adenosine(37)-N6)-threonylcarbamoyltransferase complex dimerization subunit type 1 TsaB [Aquicoccus sp. G2-2]
MPSDKLTLGFDTSVAHCAAALLRGQEIIASQVEEMSRGQAERLIPLIEEMFAKADVTWRDLDRIGVGTGPGNFTGIRISVAAARGLALGLDIPAIGVPTLDSLALDQPRPCVALVAAPREQVYLQQFLADSATNAPVLCHLDEIESLWPAIETTWVGAHADDCAKILSGEVLTPHHPLAEAIARIAASAPDESPSPTPLYIRAANATPARETSPIILDDA